MGERIQKVLARAGVASRRQVEDWIKAGRLAVNGVPATLGAQLRSRDKVTLDGRLVRVRQPDAASRVIIYHRTPGRELLPSESAESGQLFDKLPKRAGGRWVPVSPLPPNDGGLELLTNDGDLAQALMRHFASLRVVFSVRIRGELQEEQLARLLSGVIDLETTIDMESIEPAGGEGFNRWYTFSIRGGRARDVHRLCEVADVELSRLMRIALGPIKMNRGLVRGQFRTLNPGEAAELYQIAGLESPAAVERPRPRSRSGGSREREGRSAGHDSGRRSRRSRD